ncbi:cell cycle protein GpsB [Lactococcus hodotermopsidis]|uniref:Cell cycle protein GpsB n=1 Tax=Pseudolactococcus hodotermopsidis TaxID=2709157 RepID=A0A6A0BC63_9LACT|nr:DivIVA domain-containing protein [Lactococcus hodotermopsidis]GFH42283.1 cell cycle protein GpsB [Lactococcus hodotermopsidis]
MTTYNFTPKDIYDADFDIKMRGYDKDQVNDLLDNVIVDYEKFQEEILSLKEENEFLKKKIRDIESKPQIPVPEKMQRPTPPAPPVAPPVPPTIEEVKPAGELGGHVSIKPVNNFDILKRLNRLERAVFGPQALKNDIES